MAASKPRTSSVKRKKYTPSYDSIIAYKGGKNSKVRYTQHLYISKYPTQNCQVSAIGLIETVVLLKDDKLVIGEIMSELRQYTLEQIIFDVRSTYFKDVYEIFKPYATKVFKRSYVSTNGSLMAMCLLAWKK